MITVHRLNNSELIVNCNLIETMESTPDTVITLSNDKKIIVKEKLDVIIQNIIDYQRKIFQNNIVPKANEEK